MSTTGDLLLSEEGLVVPTPALPEVGKVFVDWAKAARDPPTKITAKPIVAPDRNFTLARRKLALILSLFLIDS